MNNNDRLIVRTLVDRVAEQSGPMAALQKARLAGELAAKLKILAPVDPVSVSIYNNGNNTEPAMTLDQMTAQVNTAFEAKTADKFGRKSATEVFATPAGAVTVTFDQQRRRARWGGMETKVITQIKLDGKVIAKAALLESLGETSKVRENPILKAAFMARAPELAADWADYVRRVYTHVAESFAGGVVPYSVHHQATHYMDITTTLRDGCKFEVVRGEDGRQAGILMLDEAHLATKAKDYGDQAALDWFHKTNAKLGDVSSVEMGAPGSSMQVVAERDGKKIVLDQQRIINTSPKGKLFHQFPSRLYVDGKFVPEAAYKAMFK